MNGVTITLNLTAPDGDALTRAIIQSLEASGYTVIPPGARGLTIAQIQQRVAEHFGVRCEEIVSDRRSAAIVGPRHVAMYLARKLTGYSLVVIADAFGGRDHTTVHNAMSVVKRRLETEQWLRDAISILTDDLQTAGAAALAKAA